MPNGHRNPTPEERDERIALPLDPEMALRALLKVSMDDPAVEPGQTWANKLDATETITVVAKATNTAMWIVRHGDGRDGSLPGDLIMQEYTIVTE